MLFGNKCGNCVGYYTSLVIIMYWVILAVLLVVLVVVIVKGWFLPMLVYGFMAWLGFCGLMHLFIRW